MCTSPAIVAFDTVQTTRIEATINGILLDTPSPIEVRGALNVAGSDAIFIASGIEPVDSILNIGSITASSGFFGINNQNAITTVNNAQGGNSSSASTTPLTYTGTLPLNYNIIINSPNNYGQLDVQAGTVGTGSPPTNFGVYTSSAALNNYKYSGVISGLADNQIAAGTKSGTYRGYSWLLSLQFGSSDIWDLIFGTLGPSVADTQQSLELSSSRLIGIYNLQSSALVNGLSYDCQVFDKNNICLSTGGRYSNNHGASGYATSALLIGAYRLNKNVRVGAWVDQNLSSNTATGMNLGNSKPLFGFFGAWAENPTGEGYEVKVSAGYGDKDLTVTRDVIGTSEAGVGTSRLNSQAISSVSSYGFRLNNELLASPYVGIRYSRVTSNGYTESGTDITSPLTYNRLSQENVALMAGLRLSAKLDPKTTFVASAGIEQNLKNRSGQYSATGVDGLTPIEFNSNPQKTRAIASVGAYYDIDKKQRVGVNGIYREETFKSTATTAVLATYTVGF